MTEKLPISVTIITKNEASRIEASIKSVLPFASEVIVVDSESTDETRQIAERLGAKVVTQKFRGFGQQKNFAQSIATSDWILNIDADEKVSFELELELRKFLASESSKVVEGVYLPRKTWYFNRWVMHGGWYPNYLLRFAKRTESSWTEPTLHEALEVKGKTISFKSPLEHFSFPTQRSHILKNVEYAAHACAGLKKKGKSPTGFDLIFRPFWKFVDGYFFKLGFLDGLAGLLIAFHSSYATFLRYAYLYEETAQNSHSR